MKVKGVERRVSVAVCVLLAVLGAILLGCGGGSGSGGGLIAATTPTALQATVGNAQMSQTWNASTGATPSNVKRSTTSGGPYTTIASPTATSYTDTGLTNGTTYYYLVSAVNSADVSANSAQVNATPNGPPAAPTGLAATAGNAQVSLTWNVSRGATSYHVKRSTTPGGPYRTIASPTPTAYTDTGLTNGTTYYYVVSAVNSAGQSANSAQVDATPKPPPAAPTGLAATAGNAQVSLTWNASRGATSYHVKRSTTSGGPYRTVASPTATTYTDTGLTNGITYYYVVSAVNSAGQSANSAQVNATPNAPPAAPTGLAAAAGNVQVSLTWNASRGATSYHVKRSTTSGGPYTIMASPTTTSYTDTGLTNGTTYYYVVSAVNSGGQSANSAQVSATPNGPPAAPTGLAATARNAQVGLSWNASSGATSYNVKRSTTSGGPYTTVASPTATNYTDTGLTNGTTYYYVASAVNSAGESANSTEVSATPSAAVTSVQVTIDALTNRHRISPYVYGGAFPSSAADITDSGTTVVRWGGNASSTYNWQLYTYNADNDWYFEDFTFCGLGGSSTGAPCTDSGSTQFINDVKAAGSAPLMTMVMLPWVAQSAETPGAPPSGNGHWSFSVAKYGAQCGVDPYNSDAGNGLTGDCTGTPTELLDTDLNVDYVPLLDDPSQTCPAASCVYRSQWAAALASAFGSAPHFYDMDNEIDIWGSTHFDIHPNPSGYDELSSTYFTEATKLKTWDPLAIRFGPVSCCWWFYWNGANGNDKDAHGGVDFLPWWLNEIYWQDKIAGARSLDVFDIHAYPDGPSTTGYTQAQLRALATSIYRDYWDPTYVSESGTVNQPWATQIQPNKTIPFRIPRMRAIVNMIYPQTPLSITEWSATFAGESDFSTALGDADAYGILGRERVYLASRWGAPAPANPNYQALKLFTNYDGAHHGFGTISVADTNNGDPDLFSSYAAVNSAGNTMTILVLNKDPQNSVNVQFTLDHFNAGTFAAYTLASTAPNQITALGPAAWSSTQNFAPYTATLLVISGSMPQAPASEWDLNPDTTMLPGGGTVTLNPTLISGSSTVTLGTPQSDSGISLNVTGASVAPGGKNGSIVVTAGSTPGFYHFTVPGTDGSGVAQNQSGWIVVGNSPASLTKSGDQQTGGVGTTLNLSVTIAPGSSGGTATGAPIFFTTSAGSLTYNGTTGTMLIVPTNSSGQASVTLTLPSARGSVSVTAEGPYGLGHPVATFTETAQ
jgi:fibronectin type 3 domain-containing protein